MNLNKDYTPEKVSEYLEELYNEIIQLRFELIDLKRQKAEEAREKETLVEGLQGEYNEILRTHTLYLKYKKATGNGTDNSKEFQAAVLKMIQDRKSNTGDVVTQIPKN